MGVNEQQTNRRFTPTQATQENIDRFLVNIPNPLHDQFYRLLDVAYLFGEISGGMEMASLLTGTETVQVIP